MAATVTRLACPYCGSFKSIPVEPQKPGETVRLIHDDDLMECLGCGKHHRNADAIEVPERLAQGIEWVQKMNQKEGEAK